MARVKITVTESRCRAGYHTAGEKFVVEDLCPPVCHELWSVLYPQVYALLNGGDLDHGNGRAAFFEAACPDEGRVRVRAERLEEPASGTNSEERYGTEKT